MRRVPRPKLLASALILLLTVGGYSQSKDLQKAESTGQRASEILTTFATVLGTDSIPAKLLRKAKAVAVIEIVLTDGLLDKEVRGHGLLVFNDANGWSVPTFVDCKGIRMEWGRSIFRPKQRVNVVFLFMDDRAFALIHGWRFNGPEVRGKELALGPIVGGKGADKVESTASVIYYSFEGQKLSGEEFPSTGVGSALRLSHENGLNKKVFGKKFEQIRVSGAGSIVPEPLKAVQSMLNDKFGKEGK